MPGLLLRLAYRLDRSPARVAALCGLGRMHRRLPAGYLLALPPPVAEAFSKATRLPLTEVDALTLSGSGLAAAYTPLATTRLDGGRNHAAAQRRWAVSMSSRFCPQCLEGDGSPVQGALGGSWKLRWHLPVTVACLTHSQLLSSTCPQCDCPPNRSPGSERPGLLMQRAAAALHPAQCRQPLNAALQGSTSPNRSCGGRFDRPPWAVPALDPQDLEPLLALQQRIDRHLTPAVSQPDSRDEPPDSFFFSNLIAAAHLVKFSWPLGMHLAPYPALTKLIDDHVEAVAPFLSTLPSKGLSTSPWPAPDNPAECAALLLAADSLLSDRREDGSSLRDRIQPLARTAFKRLPANTAGAFRRLAFSPEFTHALARKVHSFYYAGGHRSPKFSGPSRECQFTAAAVPALLSPTLCGPRWDDLVRRVDPSSSWTVRHLRRTASLKLVEMTAGGTWPECAEILGMPWTTAQQSLKILKRLLTPDGLWNMFDLTIHQIADHLDSAPNQVDYARRRHALRAWQLPQADWEHLRQDLPRLRERAASPDLSAASALIWARVTCGDHLHSPAVNAARASGPSAALLVSRIGQLQTPANRRGAKLQLLHRLDAYADALTSRCDRNETAAVEAETIGVPR
ncbi:TniQ family protein [Streptomyces sp. ISL-100]|nr:TniQ family protein [Streptomyces sp. ISL-100]